MATIAIMVGGAVLNASTFIAGDYVARALGGGDGATLYDKDLEDYKAPYAKYNRERTKLLDWIQTNAQKLRPSRTSPTPATLSNFITRHVPA